MLGNFDWCLRMFRGDIYRCDERHPLWNVLAFEQAGQESNPASLRLRPLRASRRTPIWFGQAFGADYVRPPSSASVEVEAQVQRTRSLFERSLLDETRAYFLASG